jgi:DNA-binding MarR family transcriptional regulator
MDFGEKILSTIRQIIRAIDLQSRNLTRKYGLTGPQLLVLKELYKENRLTSSQIAVNISLSQATVTSILDRLEKQAFVKRIKSSQDKRKITIKLEEKALKIMRTNPNLLQEQFTDRFYKLEEWEQLMLISSLQKIATMMNAESIVSPPVLTSGPLTASSPEVNSYLEETEK